ncbi:AAA family ATPase [Rathayibacter sp. YIM 133350]|uniref:ATP-binding protein n=1 Tax=Rathayibacter sp. YIM 133350 TaxID=3131992 RepID=UPI00307F1E0B
MIGRSAELGRLQSALAEAAAGSPRAVVIGGEAGIGKSRLIAEFEAAVGGSASLVKGQCVDLGAVAPPYSPVKALLRELIAQVGADAVLAAAGPGRAALAALLPELGDEAIPEVATSGAVSSGQLQEAVAVVLETLSRTRPVVAIVEDLHWIDGASLSLLRFLLRAMTAGRVLFVLSYRTDDVTRGHPVRGFLSEVERNRAVDRWELHRLTRAQVRKQVRSIRGDELTDAELATVFDRSDGIPFFVEELLGIEACALDDEIPDTLRELLLARYERLSEPAQTLLRVISTGGISVPHERLARVFDGTAAQLESAAREAVIGGVLRIDGDAYAFHHALVREAILDDLLPGERARYHARYAEAFQAEAATRRVAAEISYHFLGARDFERAFPATMRAMWEARAAYAYATAAQMGERAIELWDDVADAEAVAGMRKVELISRTASHLRNAGEGERALAMVDLGLRECEPGDPLYARLLRDKAMYRSNTGRPGSIELLEQARELARDGDEELLTGITTALAGRFMVEGRLEEAIALADEALPLAEQNGWHRNASIASNIAGVCRVHMGEIERGLDQLQRARNLARGDGSALLRYWVNSSDVMYLLGRHDEAIELAQSGLDRARALGVERSSGVILASNAVDPLIALAEWDRADALIERGLALDPQPAFRVYLQRARLGARLWRGDPAGAAAQFRALRPLMAQIADIELQTRLGVDRLAAEIALATGDARAAWQEAEVVFDSGRFTMPAYALPLLWNAARALAALREQGGSDVDLAIEERRIRDELALLSFWPTADIWSAFVEAELGSGGTGTDPVLWRTAVELAVHPTAPRLLPAYARLQLGRALLVAGDRAAARAELQQALDGASALGLGLVATDATRLAASAGLPLAGAGGVIARESTVADASLTAREQQVLDLIAEGLSNRQIGERLFISGKTASVHVSAILRKLGATSRTEAVFRAGRS